MQLFSADHPAISPCSGPIRPALTDFTDEVCATVARLFAYVGVLMLFGILGVHGWQRMRVDVAAEPRSVAAARPLAASPSDASDKSGKSDTYLALRHPPGGFQDLFRLRGTSERPAAVSGTTDWMTDAPQLRGAF